MNVQSNKGLNPGLEFTRSYPEEGANYFSAKLADQSGRFSKKMKYILKFDHKYWLVVILHFFGICVASNHDCESRY